MNKPIFSIPLKYGAIASALLILLFAVLFYSGRHPLSIPVFLDVRIFILPLFMFFAMREFRNSDNEGVLHFWQGLSIGFITFITVGIVIAVFILFFVAIDKTFLTEYIAERVGLLQQYQEQFNEALGETVVEEQLNKLPLTTALDLAKDYFAKTVVIGLFLNIIISILLRRQPKLN